MSAAAASSVVSGLTADQLSQFRRDGFLILPDFFSAETADRLKARVSSMLDQFDLATHPKTIFKTTSEGRQTASPSGPASPPSAAAAAAAEGSADAASAAAAAGKVSLSSLDPNRYFLDSASAIHYFFEERAFSASGELIVPKAQSINKIGHFLHELDAAFSEFTYRPEVKALAASIGMQQPVVLQSMVICMWFALEDCTQSNGCLSFVPGSHKDGSNTKRFGRAESAAAPLRATINNPGFDSSAKQEEQGPNNAHIDLEFTGTDPRLSSYAPSDFVPAEVKKGSCVLIDGEVVHQSERNLSALSRFIYTFHLIDAAGTTYSAKNWLQMKQQFPRLNQ